MSYVKCIARNAANNIKLKHFSSGVLSGLPSSTGRWSINTAAAGPLYCRIYRESKQRKIILLPAAAENQLSSGSWRDSAVFRQLQRISCLQVAGESQLYSGSWRDSAVSRQLERISCLQAGGENLLSSGSCKESAGFRQMDRISCLHAAGGNQLSSGS